MKTKGEQWFEWEREATIHPILMCMEAWCEPIKKAYGKSWPSAIIIYNGDIVSWYDPLSELLEYGDYLIKKFAIPQKMNVLRKEIESQAKELEEMFYRFEELHLEKLTDQKLLETYEELHSNYVKWFIPGGLVEPIGHQGEQLVREIVAENEFALVTTTTAESFSKRELKDLLRIAVAKKQGKQVNSLLEKHAKKYFWIHNSYFSTEVLDWKFFETELELAMKKYPKPEQQMEKLETELIEVTRKKKELLEKIKLSEFERNLIELLDLFAWYQDYRKEYTMQMLHHLDKILEEIGKRKGFTLREMKYTLPDEIPKLIGGKFDREIIEERQIRYLFYFNSKTGKIESGIGQWSIRKEEEVFHSLKHEDEVLEINGMVASKGFVRGYARVTMIAKDAKEIKPGEILITSMTTPDFVTSMKRAAAIVTNEGGILCHAAVVSREFGIPCIVGTKLATKIFKTGDLIEVDGELGIVRKCTGT